MPDKLKWSWCNNNRTESEVTQLCPTLCDPMDCCPPGSSVHGILQTRILEWVAISFSRGSAWPRNPTQVSRIAGSHFNLWATRKLKCTINNNAPESSWNHTALPRSAEKLSPMKPAPGSKKIGDYYSIPTCIICEGHGCPQIFPEIHLI